MKGTRLACCTTLVADAEVVLTVEEEFRTEHILDKGIRSDVVIDPEVKRFCCELPPSTLEHPVSDWERVIQALPDTYRSEARSSDPRHDARRDSGAHHSIFRAAIAHSGR